MSTNISPIEQKEKENDKEEKKLTLAEMELQTKEIFDELLWLCDMYSEIGESEAKGIKFVRKNEVNWERPLLNRKRQEIFKNSKLVINGNYKHLIKTSKQKPKRKMPVRADGTKQDNLGMPIIISRTMIDFFNSVNLGTTTMNGKKVKVQKLISALNNKERILSPHIITNLFNLWILNSNLSYKGKVVQETLRDKERKGRVFTDEIFAKYFGKDVDKMIEEKKLKYLPVKDDKVVINGETVTVPYSLPYPTFFASLAALHRENIQDKEKKNALYAQMKEETNLIKKIYEEAKK